jgi:hypothetical protein
MNDLAPVRLTSGSVSESRTDPEVHPTKLTDLSGGTPNDKTKMIATNSIPPQLAATLPLTGNRSAAVRGLDRWATWLAYFAFAAALFGCKLWLIGSYGNPTPFGDQWDGEAATLYRPFLEGTLRGGDLFATHNEHRIVTTRLLALALLKLNGTWNPFLQMVVNAALHVAVLALIVGLLARVVGRAYLPALLLFNAVFFAVPFAWENTLWGFQSQFYFVVLFSVGCMWLTVIREPFSLGWWGGAACGLLAFLSLASGTCATAVAALAGIAFYATGLRRSRKQLAAVAVLAGLSAAGVALTPTIPYHAALKAASLPDFIHAWKSTLGWPVSSHTIGVALVYLPALAFATATLRKRPSLGSPRWFLLALVAWMIVQTSLMAYSRALYSTSSRYLDIFAVGILVNFACTISLAGDCRGKRFAWAAPAAGLWPVAILVCLGVRAAICLPGDLAAKRLDGQEQQSHAMAFLTTGDISQLKNSPLRHIPYPNAERLAALLSTATIRDILPAELGASTRTGRLDRTVTGLLAAFNVCLMLGFAAMLSLSMRLGTACQTVMGDRSASLRDVAVASPEAREANCAGKRTFDQTSRPQRKAS